MHSRKLTVTDTVAHPCPLVWTIKDSAERNRTHALYLLLEFLVAKIRTQNRNK